MTRELTPGLIDVGGNLVENYERVTIATDEAKSRLGLDPTQEYKASIGIAAVEEYVIFREYGIPKNETRDFYLSRSQQPLRLASLYIDSPNSDVIVFEIHKDGVGKLMDFTLIKNKTPFEFPDAPLDNDLIIKVKALDNINYVQLVFKPCVILAEFASGEPLVDQST